MKSARVMSLIKHSATDEHTAACPRPGREIPEVEPMRTDHREAEDVLNLPSRTKAEAERIYEMRPSMNFAPEVDDRPCEAVCGGALMFGHGCTISSLAAVTTNASNVSAGSCCGRQQPRHGRTVSHRERTR